ncbi:CRIB domain-containing protein RIC6, partial [Striga asiatica]
MTTSKMKGLLKGLRYISQIFDDVKEQEIQIGHPTDVKHVAHIGWDGPAVDSPSWMKEFKSSRFQSAPLGPPLDSIDNPEIKWVSEDSKRGHNRASTSSSKKDLPELPKSSRRNSENNNISNDSPRKQKSRKSRKHQAKDYADISIQATQESISSNSDIPRKSRQKKSQESNGGGCSTRSRYKGTISNDIETSHSNS